jgi:hypothetical protein
MRHSASRTRRRQVISRAVIVTPENRRAARRLAPLFSSPDRRDATVRFTTVFVAPGYLTIVIGIERITGFSSSSCVRLAAMLTV